MTFKQFKKLIQEQIDDMVTMGGLFVTDVEKSVIYNTYLESFETPETKQEHTCSCCQRFLRPFGNLVAIDNGNKTITIWDKAAEKATGEYQKVAQKMAALIKDKAIVNPLVLRKAEMGVDHNFAKSNGRQWEHFFYELPENMLHKGKKDVAEARGYKRETRGVFKRSLDEVTIDAIDSVMELITSNSLLNGDRSKFALSEFRKHKVAYEKLPIEQRENYCWKHYSTVIEEVAKIRNTALGVLIIDISKDLDMAEALRKWDVIQDPTNYRRSTVTATKAQREKARREFEELGLMASLPRRFAIASDISINDVLWANRAVKMKDKMDAFELLDANAKVSPKEVNKVEEISIEKFLTDVLPNLEKLEIMPENKHLANLVSMTTAQDATAPALMAWGSNAAWTYRGNVTDTIKERVKAAGGNVEGALRCSLSWYNTDDLDLHVIEPNGKEIYFGDKVSRTGGNLDVDMNAWNITKDPVENVAWPSENRMLEGEYVVKVNNFNKRSTTKQGFIVQIEYNGVRYHFVFDKNPANGEREEKKTIAKFKWSRSEGLKITFGNVSESSSNPQEQWGIKTQTWQEVSLVSLSPNYWGEKTVGVKHYFFFIKDCISNENPSGFFSEYLHNDLREHRKTVEMLTETLRCEDNPNQLSGLGFNSTVRNSVVVRTTSKNTVRTMKINF